MAQWIEKAEEPVPNQDEELSNIVEDLTRERSQPMRAMECLCQINFTHQRRHRVDP